LKEDCRSPPRPSSESSVRCWCQGSTSYTVSCRCRFFK